MPNGGACQIFTDQGSDIWSLFNTGGAFPSTAFINHEIQVHDLMNNAGSWSINNRISDIIIEDPAELIILNLSNIYTNLIIFHFGTSSRHYINKSNIYDFQLTEQIDRDAFIEFMCRYKKK